MSTETECVNVIKAIISSYDGELPIEQLEEKYEMWEWSLIPYLKFGFNSLNDLLRKYPEIKIVKNKQNESVYTVKSVNRSTAENFVPKFEKKNNRKDRRFMPYRKARTSGPRKTSSPVNFDSSWKDSYGTNSFRPSSASSRTSRISKGRKSPEIIIDPHKSMDVVAEPIINGQQLIGDDFFLQLAIKSLNATLYRKSFNAPLYTGLCVSGQSIRACTKRLKRINSIANKVTIMLGSVDIFEGRTLEQMKDDYEELLDTLEQNFNLSKSSITIGTIVPLANVSFMTQYEEYSTLVCFNNWLRQLIQNKCDDLGQRKFHYKLIDFHKEFSTDINGVNYDYFQDDARNVSGIRHGYVLFNNLGRSKAVSLFFINPQLEENNKSPSSNWSYTSVYM